MKIKKIYKVFIDGQEVKSKDINEFEKKQMDLAWDRSDTKKSNYLDIKYNTGDEVKSIILCISDYIYNKKTGKRQWVVDIINNEGQYILETKKVKALI